METSKAHEKIAKLLK